MQIGKDTFVILEYTVRLANGEIVRGENGPASMNFVVGYEQILPSLERRLFGMEEGNTARFVIPAVEAFGEWNPKQQITRAFDEFPQGRDLQAGKFVVATNAGTGALYSYYVKAKDEYTVTLDYNHPLAGKDLHYEITIVKVRSATIEELQYLRPCEFTPDGQYQDPEL